ncbi:hypothetical protein BV394_10410 [Brevirhabdus pacifica]|uniref:Uncharacterized protein n=2 Tax=Brevirhabdus pacifica TaxID=1267768 RepID=A0A1U7DJL7_9RHOB|nr:trimeric intracellular cation channel family protein [Brevirhabdus pacifica]APX90079.1 hypothetical protein BV394_10410 [Brevirhabdus pacifica]OWU75331.1 membrane protein [Loktanella sp. 22II-4b]PJJ82668.1 putative membrane protein YeiH [Brevirhabdus pacifica]
MEAAAAGATLVQVLDLAAVFVFALTGGLSASRAQLDPVGFIFVAAVTGLGGGTLRDLILDRTPVFWVANPYYLLVAAIAALLVFFTAHLLMSRLRAIYWLDALALGMAVPAGLAVAVGLGADWPIAITMGIITASFGGIARDVICNEVPVVLQEGELYITAAFAGGAAGMAALAVTGSPVTMALVCGFTAVIIRAAALAFNLRLPRYKPRPPRER